MFYRCCYCGRAIRPRDNVESNGNPDAISDGNCRRCNRIVMTDMDLSPAEVRRKSLGSIPACMRSAKL